MPNTCVACGCRNTPENTLAGISFHKFPKKESLREAWAKAFGKKNWTPTTWSFLCSRHFTEDLFDRTSCSVIRLRENAVPNVFRPKGCLKTKSSKGSQLEVSSVIRRTELQEVAVCDTLEQEKLPFPALYLQQKVHIDNNQRKLIEVNGKLTLQLGPRATNFAQNKPTSECNNQHENPSNAQKMCNLDDLSHIDIPAFRLDEADDIEEPCDLEGAHHVREYILPQSDFFAIEPLTSTSTENKQLNDEILRLRQENALLSDELRTLKNTLLSVKVDNYLERTRSQKIIAKFRKALRDCQCGAISDDDAG